MFKSIVRSFVLTVVSLAIVLILASCNSQVSDKGTGYLYVKALDCPVYEQPQFTPVEFSLVDYGPEYIKVAKTFTRPQRHIGMTKLVVVEVTTSTETTMLVTTTETNVDPGWKIEEPPDPNYNLTCNKANPGNDKCKGASGETPNGKSGWNEPPVGTGTHGRSPRP